MYFNVVKLLLCARGCVHSRITAQVDIHIVEYCAEMRRSVAELLFFGTFFTMNGEEKEGEIRNRIEMGKLFNLLRAKML